MDTGFIATQVKRAALRTLIASAVILALAFLFAGGWVGLLALGGETDLVLYACFVVPGLVILAIFGWKLGLAILVLQNPLESASLNPLKRFGPLPLTIGQIDSEIAAAGEQIGAAHITRHWLVQAPSNSLGFMRLEDVIWIYKQVTQHKVRFYYVISVPTRKTYSAVVWDRHGNCLSMVGSENDANRALQAIGNRAPWAVAGYGDDMAREWRRDRASFIAAIDRRRQQLFVPGR
jgi:hypothetical protein